MDSKNLNIEIGKYRIILKNLAYKFTKDPDDIQDLVQETLLRALKYIDQFVDNPRVVSWLFVIMKNIYINHYRSQQQKYGYESHQADDYTKGGIQEPFIESSAEKRLILKDVHFVLNLLPIEHQEIFQAYVSGYKYRELAEMYAIPEGTIKSRVFLIRKKLQKQFPEYA